MSPGNRLRALIASKGLAHLMAAHSPLSALLAEQAGFDGIWASGFELSALFALPDMSLITMTQHLDMVRAMVAATGLPVVADIDTGFGNAVNAMHAVRAYEAAGAAGVVIEDKVFPKVTSLVAGGRQTLVRVEEFQGKIAGATTARHDQDFLVVARTEALIAGLGQEEAIARAMAYGQAGADMILVHSKERTADEIKAFTRAWEGPIPLVIVPTRYPELNEQRILDLQKIAMVIYANHAIRACVTAMRDTFAKIRRDGGIEAVDQDLVSTEAIFDLQGMPDALRAERDFVR